LVLKAQIGTYDLDRIFMDAGSGINLIYAKTLQAMHISLEFLKSTDCSFHGIVLGSVKVHMPPCVVLVINDNPYGLMFALSYICRTYPLTTLDPYVGFKVVRS
jgi:hypothetical protein